MSEIPTVTISGRTFRLICDTVLRRLTDDEARGLRQDVEAAGEVLVPVIVTQHDDVIDGGHRLRIAADLGLTLDKVPLVVRHVEDQAEAEELCRRLNVNRRHLTAAERREQIAMRLKADPTASNRKVAAEVGADDHTVATVREKLESTAEIPQLDKTTGKDGKKRKVARKSPAVRKFLAIAANFFRTAERSAEADLGTNGKGKASASKTDSGGQAPRYPHSTLFMRWVRTALDEANDLVEGPDGVDLTMWGEPGLWNWREVRDNIIPCLDNLLEILDLARRLMKDRLIKEQADAR
jgi:hypothetical protein